MLNCHIFRHDKTKNRMVQAEARNTISGIIIGFAYVNVNRTNRTSIPFAHFQEPERGVSVIFVNQSTSIFRQNIAIYNWWLYPFETRYSSMLTFYFLARPSNTHRHVSAAGRNVAVRHIGPLLHRIIFISSIYIPPDLYK